MTSHDGTARAAIESLAAQLIFLEANLETDIGGNHLIKNIKALIWASAFFQGPDAARWRKLGLDLLARELTAQILTDGVHYERSPSYHCQRLADLLECRHALGAETPPALDAALRAILQSPDVEIYRLRGEAGGEGCQQAWLRPMPGAGTADPGQGPD